MNKKNQKPTAGEMLASILRGENKYTEDDFLKQSSKQLGGAKVAITNNQKL